MIGKKFYTIIVVPHAKAKFRKLRVPYNLFIGAGVVAVLVVLGIFFLSYRMAGVSIQKDELSRLRRENVELRHENEQTRQVTEEIKTKLGGFQETVGRFKVLFGVGGEAASGMGELSAGGEPPENDPNEKYKAFDYLSRLKADAESLEKELSQISGDIEERAVVWNSTPSIRPVLNGFVSSNYGYRVDPFTGKRVFHPAIDISTWYWDEIHAPADGIVTRTGKNKGSGLFVELSHGFGYTTIYAHLKRFNVKPGQEVKRHDVLGYVGNTGRSTGPHLHYEVRYQGKPINPATFMMEPEEEIL
jgi:murein DD-endopeptidase MepM/ murein hydrolase activator NlpD